MKRIGIDVGGTNTDAVLVQNNSVVAAVKVPTTQDVMSGVLESLRQLVAKVGDQAQGLDAVMIGTTHFVNAVVQRRDLVRVGAIRVSLPASQSLEPMIDWPRDLRDAVNPLIHLVEGGHEYDGRLFMPLDEAGVRDAARRIVDQGVRAIGITATFSPLTAEHELRAAEIVREVDPGVAITLSHRLGRMGLLEHLVIIRVDRDVGVNIAVTRVHVQCHKHTTFQNTAMNRLQLGKNRGIVGATKETLELRLDFHFPGDAQGPILHDVKKPCSRCV